MIWDNLLISGSLIIKVSVKFLLPSNVIYTQVLEIRIWTSLGGSHNSAYHRDTSSLSDM